MTSKPSRVRLEVLVDAEDAALCGASCRFLARECRQDGNEHHWCTASIDHKRVHPLLHRRGETFRSKPCRESTKAVERDEAIVAAAIEFRDGLGDYKLKMAVDAKRADEDVW